ncbi:MAG: hypothetical protein CL927_00515 [Deltaproteobacteria bacterium]|nr:hypothetical protein [Deltaproteobacteria bacterium]HCH61488.1 hypothetical protein [Deltaproteobacteria bacterium]
MDLWNIEALFADGSPPPAVIGPSVRARLAVLFQRHLPPSGRLLHLEVGPGAAAAVLARRFRGWQFHPVVRDGQKRAEVEVWRGLAAVENLKAPRLDATDSTSSWTARCFDAVLVGPASLRRVQAVLPVARHVLEAGGICLVVLDADVVLTEGTLEAQWSQVDSDESGGCARIFVLQMCGG